MSFGSLNRIGCLIYPDSLLSLGGLEGDGSLNLTGCLVYSGSLGTFG